jgi:hypothetical protein
MDSRQDIRLGEKLDAAAMSLHPILEEECDIEWDADIPHH